MISKYYRPDSVKKAVKILTKHMNDVKPLGGGTQLSRQQGNIFGVVDLQAVGLDTIRFDTRQISVGAAARLDALLSHPKVDPEIKRAIRLDASENIRNIATLGGWLVSSDGRSAFSTILLTLDTVLAWEPDSVKVRMGDWLPAREAQSPGVLLTEATWSTLPKLVFEFVARSPKDRPTLIVAAARWDSGRTRIAIGGFGEAPIIAMDGPESQGADIASREACFEAEDAWASAEYRREVAPKLAVRCLERIDAMMESEA